MAVDFSAILSKQTSDIKKPKPKPVGTYLCNNPQLPKFQGAGKNEHPVAVILAPQDDVDAEELGAYQTEFGEIRGKTLRHTHWLNSDGAMNHSKEELVNAWGIEEEGKSLGQMYNETINRQVLVTIKHRPSEDGTDMFEEIEKLAAV